MENKIYDLLEKMYINFDNRFNNVEAKLTKLDNEVTTLKTDVSSVKSDVTTLKSDVGSLKSDVTTLKTDVGSLKSDVKKNSIVLEKINTNVKTLAEVQSSFSEQLDRAKDKDGKTLGERLDVIELSVTNTSKSINDLVETVEVIKETTGSHEMDIKILKKFQHNPYI